MQEVLLNRYRLASLLVVRLVIALSMLVVGHPDHANAEDQVSRRNPDDLDLYSKKVLKEFRAQIAERPARLETRVLSEISSLGLNDYAADEIYAMIKNWKRIEDQSLFWIAIRILWRGCGHAEIIDKLIETAAVNLQEDEEAFYADLNPFRWSTELLSRACFDRVCAALQSDDIFKQQVAALWLNNMSYVQTEVGLRLLIANLNDLDVVVTDEQRALAQIEIQVIYRISPTDHSAAGRLLQKLWQHPDRAVATSARHALDWINLPQDTDPDQVIQFCLDAVERNRKGQNEDFSTVVDLSLDRAIAAMARSGIGKAQILTEAGRNDSPLQYSCVQSLRHFKDEPEVKKALHVLLANNFEEIRQIAAFQLLTVEPDNLAAQRVFTKWVEQHISPDGFDDSAVFDMVAVLGPDAIFLVPLLSKSLQIENISERGKSALCRAIQAIGPTAHSALPAVKSALQASHLAGESRFAEDPMYTLALLEGPPFKEAKKYLYTDQSEFVLESLHALACFGPAAKSVNDDILKIDFDSLGLRGDAFETLVELNDLTLKMFAIDHLTTPMRKRLGANLDSSEFRKQYAHEGPQAMMRFAESEIGADEHVEFLQELLSRNDPHSLAAAVMLFKCTSEKEPGWNYLVENLQSDDLPWFQLTLDHFHDLQPRGAYLAKFMEQLRKLVHSENTDKSLSVAESTSPLWKESVTKLVELSNPPFCHDTRKAAQSALSWLLDQRPGYSARLVRRRLDIVDDLKTSLVNWPADWDETPGLIHGCRQLNWQYQMAEQIGEGRMKEGNE